MRAAPDGDPAECTEEHGHIDERREREIPLPALIDRVRRRRSQDSNQPRQPPGAGRRVGIPGRPGHHLPTAASSPFPVLTTAYSLIESRQVAIVAMAGHCTRP